MERGTKAQVDRVFARLLEVLGKRLAKSYKDVGGWQLDYNPTYGGYMIEEIHNDKGGVCTPMGQRRMPAREFHEALHFAISAVVTKGVK